MPKTWFITGASSGLGLEMTRQLLERGDRIVATVRRPGALAELQGEAGSNLRMVQLDVTDTPALRQTLVDAFAELGRIDVVVSNAGYGLLGAAEELADADIEQLIATNLLASMHMVRAALPHLRGQGGGRIVQVSSEGGQIAYPGLSAYHATKWGIEGFMEAVALEVAPFNIQCIIAEPGPTATNFGRSLVMAPPLAAYDATPVGAVRQSIADGSFVIKGDAARTAAAILAAADAADPPFRLTLGSTAFQSVSTALERRLAGLRGQRETAFSADRPD